MNMMQAATARDFDPYSNAARPGPIYSARDDEDNVLVGSLDDITSALVRMGYDIEGPIGHEGFYTIEAYIDNEAYEWKVTKAKIAARII